MKWEYKKIKSLCTKLTSGGTPSRKKPEFYVDGTIPWLKTKELKDCNIYDAEEYITEDALKQSSAKLFPINTVLIAMYGDGRTITSLGILKRKAATNQACCAFFANSDVCNYMYLFYVLKFHRGALIKRALGGAQRNLSVTKISDFEVIAPPITIQNKIASILSAYDVLIENNLKRIKILEEMAQMIYREWFVNFRFPGHENVKMVDSPLGKIPEGWAVGRLDDAIVLQRGFDLPKKKRKNGTVPIYASTGVTDMHNEAKVKGPGVVTGRSGSLGMVTYIDDDFWPLNTTLWVKEFKRFTPLVAYYHLSSMGLEQYNTGVAVPTLNRNNIHGFSVAFPSEEMQARFDDFVLPMFDEIKTLRLKNANLRKTRDLLLPKLISGELDVEGLDIKISKEVN